MIFLVLKGMKSSGTRSNAFWNHLWARTHFAVQGRLSAAHSRSDHRMGLPGGTCSEAALVYVEWQAPSNVISVHVDVCSRKCTFTHVDLNSWKTKLNGELTLNDKLPSSLSSSWLCVKHLLKKHLKINLDTSWSGKRWQVILTYRPTQKSVL